MAESLLDLAHYAIQLAEDRGAQGAWATAHRSRKVEFTGRDGLLEKVQENTSRSVGLQLYVDGRYSSHRTTSLRPERMEAFIAEAVELTRALAPDPHRQLPDPALFEGRSSDDLELLDGSVDAISREQRQAWLDELDAGARADEAVISATAYVSDTHSEKASASSNGFEGSFASTSVWAGAEVTVRDEGERRPEGGYWLRARQVKGIPGLRDL